VNDFDGHAASDERVDGFVNDAHGAAAQLARDLIAADALRKRRLARGLLLEKGVRFDMRRQQARDGVQNRRLAGAGFFQKRLPLGLRPL